MDILIRNAELVDGTAAPKRRADVAVENGLITAIAGAGEIDPANAAEVIEAEGQLLTPGFIDPHTHYDGQATWDDRLAPSCEHGITTVVMGNCGVGFAPVRPSQKEVLIDLMEGVEDIPGAALHDGIRWNWESFPQYLDALESLPRSIDVAAQIPHGALRTYAMAEGGEVNRTATDDEVRTMARLAQEAAEAGGLAFSSNRIAMHTSTSGESVPGTFAESREVGAIIAGARAGGRDVFQVVPEGLMGENPDGFRHEVDFYRSLSLETGCTVLYTIAQNNVQPDLWRELLDRTDAANAEGARLVPMTNNRPGGMLLSWESFHPFLDRPSYVEVADRPLREKVAALREPERRARVLAEPIASPMFRNAYQIIMDGLGASFSPGVANALEPDPADSLARQIERAGVPAQDFLYDTLCDAAERDEGPGFISIYMGNYANGSLEETREMLCRPGFLLGGADGGAHVTVICDASYPTFMLQHWVRDRTRGPRIPIEQAVQMMTQRPAELHRLDDRGVVAVGKRADLNVIDLDRIALTSPRVEYDLPTGAPRLLESARGYTATLVAGEVTSRDGQDTGARPGGLVRN